MLAKGRRMKELIVLFEVLFTRAAFDKKSILIKDPDYYQIMI